MRWLPEALADVERLHAFLREKSPAAADRAVRAILVGSETLATSPAIGRPMDDETGRREWFVLFGAGAYVLRYKLDREMPVVIRVWHSFEAR